MNRSSDWVDLAFRLLFCTIFVALGGEHLWSDALIRQLMPDWIPWPRTFSVLAGLWLAGWAALLVLGWKLRWVGIALGVYVGLVTIVIHGHGLVSVPPQIPVDCQWLWQVLQRSNLAKNLCLLGVCIRLCQYQPGRFSLENWLGRRSGTGAWAGTADR